MHDSEWTVIPTEYEALELGRYEQDIDGLYTCGRSSCGSSFYALVRFRLARGLRNDIRKWPFYCAVRHKLAS